jgi:L-iditol 2-dehydrogenase
MIEAVLEKAGRIVVRDTADAIAVQGEALIAVQRVGICGSDLHAYRGEHPFIHPPIVLGHEFAGLVVSAPADSGFRPGDRVTVEPSLVCGHCDNCKSGRYNICDHLRVIGCQARGAMAGLIAVPAGNLLMLPDSVSWDEACLVEPLAVGVHAMRRAGIEVGESVLILGAGTIGLMCLAAARAMGAGAVMVADPVDWRRDLALSLGADDVCENPAICANSAEPLLPAPSLILECTGNGAAAEQAVSISRKGGRIVIVGVHSKPALLEIGLIQDWELDVRGTLMYTRGDFEEALNLIAEQRVRTESLITHRMHLAHVAEAFRVLSDPALRALKIILTVA